MGDIIQIGKIQKLRAIPVVKLFFCIAHADNRTENSRDMAKIVSICEGLIHSPDEKHCECIPTRASHAPEDMKT